MRLIIQIKTIAYLNGVTEVADEVIREFTIVTKGRGAVNIHTMAAQLQYLTEGTEKFRTENIKTYSETKRRVG